MENIKIYNCFIPVLALNISEILTFEIFDLEKVDQ